MPTAPPIKPAIEFITAARGGSADGLCNWPNPFPERVP
jgi:hypothetical protein